MKNDIPTKSKGQDIAPLLKLEAAVFYLPLKMGKKIRPIDLVPAVRSAVGRILKQRFCPYPDCGERRCRECERAKDCCYTVLFAPGSGAAGQESQKRERGGGPAKPPRPYILHMPVPEGKDAAEAGEESGLQLILIGKGAAAFRRPMLESVYQAIAHIGRAFSLSPGVWRSVFPCPAEGGVRLLRRQGKEVFAEPASAPLFHWIQALPGGRDFYGGAGRERTLELRFTTPLQMKRSQGDFSLPPFIKTILGRLRDLKRIYGEDTDMGRLGGDFFTGVQMIRVFSSLSREKNSWFSQHRRKRIDLGGLQGQVILKGEVTPYLPLLAAGFFLGAGSKTVYGLGQYDFPGWEMWPMTLWKAED